MLPSLRPLLAGVALAGVLGLSACGDTADESTPTTAAEGSGPSGEAADCAGAAGERVIVDIGDFVFEPPTVSVSACDEIVWTNTHDQAHTSTGNGGFEWSTGNIAPGSNAAPIVFDTPGDYSYICALHPFMKGSVEVS